MVFFRPQFLIRLCLSWLATGMLAGLIPAVAEEPAPEFGKDVQLAPFVVNGKPLSIAIHARTKGDRRYGEKFADEVVEVAYETMGDSTGRGLVIVGVKGEPHPVTLFRKFAAMAAAGQVDAGLAEAAVEVGEALKKLEGKFTPDDSETQRMGITFDTFLPAMPMPLPGVTARLYQLAWAEGFDEAKVEHMLRSQTRESLTRSDLAQYDWVFYLPPQSATAPVLKELMDKAMRGQKMGVFKRAAIKSAVFAFKPVINKAVEGFRKGLLFQAILTAESGWSEDDIRELTKAYGRELMPDLKPGSGDEKRRALAAIEKQKIANAEYAKDPFVKPARLASYDSAAYAAFEGDYTDKAPETTHRFVRAGDEFQWNYRDHKPRPFHPAGDRLLVNNDGTMTIQFLVDDTGRVTGVEERWVRRRKTVERKT